MSIFKMYNNELVFINNLNTGISLDSESTFNKDQLTTIPKDFKTKYIYLGIDGIKTNFKLLILDKNMMGVDNSIVSKYITIIKNNKYNDIIIKIDSDIFKKYLIVDLVLYNITEKLNTFIYTDTKHNFISIYKDYSLCRVFRLFNKNDTTNFIVKGYQANESISKYGLNYFECKILC